MGEPGDQPELGLLIGWTVIFSDIVVNANQAQIAGSYGFQLFGLDKAAANTLDVIILGVIFISCSPGSAGEASNCRP